MSSPPGSRAFPGWDAVFDLGQGGSAGGFMADLELAGGSSFSALRGEHRPAAPLRARWALGTATAGQIVWTRRVSPLLLSDELVLRLRGEGFSGWGTYPVELTGRDGAPIPGYQGLVIHGRCGPLDDRRAQPVPKQYPAGTFTAWKGVFFDESTWDGSDFFMPEGNNGWMFVVERVVKAFERWRVKNVQFTALRQVERASL